MACSPHHPLISPGEKGNEIWNWQMFPLAKEEGRNIICIKGKLISRWICSLLNKQCHMCGNHPTCPDCYNIRAVALGQSVREDSCQHPPITATNYFPEPQPQLLRVTWWWEFSWLSSYAVYLLNLQLHCKMVRKMLSPAEKEKKNTWRQPELNISKWEMPPAKCGSRKECF